MCSERRKLPHDVTDLATAWPSNWMTLAPMPFNCKISTNQDMFKLKDSSKAQALGGFLVILRAAPSCYAFGGSFIHICPSSKSGCLPKNSSFKKYIKYKIVQPVGH
jgi:hypothetical protein